MSQITNVNENKTSVKQKEIKIIRRPKTERKYERVLDSYDLCRIIAKHGDKVAFSYYDKSRTLCELSYERFYNRIVRTAAGLTKKGLAGKKVAIVGETSVAWLASYLAILTTGGVVIPMDKELEPEAIVGLLESVDADAIIYSSSFNGKLVDKIGKNSSIKILIPIDPDDNELSYPNTIAYRAMRAEGKEDVDAGKFQLSPVANREVLAEMLFTSGTTGTS